MIRRRSSAPNVWRLAGIDVLADGWDQLRGRKVGIVFQNSRAALNPIRTIGRQLADVFKAHGDSVARAICPAVVAALTDVRIPDPTRRIGAYPGELSGGMCQRVMLAIALAGNPSLLVADEPTTGLDVTTQSAILALLLERVRARRMAAILITHDLELARAYAERIIVMHAGQIVEDAPAAALVREAAAPLFRVVDRGDARPRAQRRRRSPAFPARRPISTPARPPAASPTAASAQSRAAAAEFPPLRVEADGPRFPLLATAMSRLLEVTGLRKLFPVGHGAKLHAVDDVDFDLAEGESLGVIGESGSGKSTIARLIARLADPTAGRIRFEGRDIGAIPSRKFAGDVARKSIQLVFQSAGDSLNPAYSAARNIAVGLGLDSSRSRGPANGRRSLPGKSASLQNCSTAARINCPAASRRVSASPERWPASLAC